MVTFIFPNSKPLFKILNIDEISPDTDKVLVTNNLMAWLKWKFCLYQINYMFLLEAHVIFAISLEEYTLIRDMHQL